MSLRRCSIGSRPAKIVAFYIIEADVRLAGRLMRIQIDVGVDQSANLFYDLFKDADTHERKKAARSTLGQQNPSSGAAGDSDELASRASIVCDDDLNIKVRSRDGLTAEAFRAALVERFGAGVASLERQGLLNIAYEADADGRDAWYDPATGEAFFVPGRIGSAAEAVAAVLHEVGAHFGLDGALGPRAWRTLKSRIASLARQGKNDVAAVWMGVLDTYPEFAEYVTNPTAALDNDRFMHEVIARLGETAAGRKSGLWRDLLAAVNRFLLKMGIGRQINKNELADLVAGSLRRVMDGQGPGGPRGGVGTMASRKVDPRQAALVFDAANIREVARAVAMTYPVQVGDASTAEDSSAWRKAQVAKAWAAFKPTEEEPRRNVVRNPKFDIHVTHGGLKHNKAHSGDVRKMLFLDGLREALERAVFVRSERPDARKQDDKNIVAYHKMAVPMKFGAQHTVVRITLQEDARGRVFYDTDVTDAEVDKPTDVSSGPTVAAGATEGLSDIQRAYLNTTLSTFGVNGESPMARRGFDAADYAAPRSTDNWIDTRRACRRRSATG